MPHRKRQVAIILRLHQNYDRGVLHGIAAYGHEHKNWSIYVEEDASQRIPDLRNWKGDGLIVNLDDKKAAKATVGLAKPIVGIGGGEGWHDKSNVIPYVATDDERIGQLAAEHFMARGLTQFAFCGYPSDPKNIWGPNRANAFAARLAQEGFECNVYRGRYVSAQRWDRMQERLVAWLQTLPTPIGVLASFDSRARHVLEACQTLGLRVPDDVAVLGVDNNELTCELSEPPLSSIEQGCFRIGYTAARLLDQLMQGKQPDQLVYHVEPIGVVSRQSTNLLNVEDRMVAQALRLIRDEACQGMHADLVSREVQLSRSTLDKRFKNAIGRTVDQEVRRVRLTRAKELLSRTELPMREVARQAGYGNEQYLARVIRDATHTTPAAYRRDHRAARTGAGLSLPEQARE